MKALYFSTLPPDFEALKAADPTRFTIMGSHTYISAVFSALLRYGSYDRMFVPSTAQPPFGDLRNSEVFRNCRDRVQFLPEYQLQTLRHYSRTVFMTPLADVHNVTRLRRLSGCRSAPITGVIHSINHSQQLVTVLLLLLSPLYEYDALICSSTAGKIAMSRFFDLLCERLSKSGWPPLKPRLQMPIIPLGVEVSEFDGTKPGPFRHELSPQGGPVLLYFGRFSAFTKADLLPLILAVVRLHAIHDNISLVLAGDDTNYQMADMVREFANQHAPQVPIRIIKNPDFETKKQIYASADIFVSPADSLQETFGITIIEAMASGLPIVVSDWNGYKDLVIDSETGFRIHTMMPKYTGQFDNFRGTGAMTKPDLLAATTMVDVEELVQKLSILIANPEKRRAMGEAARRRARAYFDWPIIIAAYEHLWDELWKEERWHQQVTSHSSLEIDQFGYQEIFSHYPTEFLDENSYVMLSELTGSMSDRLEWLEIKNGDETIPWFRRELFMRILNRLSFETSTQVSSLLKLFDDERDTGFLLTLSHLSRLIKYGIVKRAGCVAKFETEQKNS